MGEEVKLKPCPFCWGIPNLESPVRCFGHGEYTKVYRVLCVDCGAQSRGFAEHYEKDPVKLAIEAWNRREHHVDDWSGDIN